LARRRSTHGRPLRTDRRPQETLLAISTTCHQAPTGSLHPSTSPRVRRTRSTRCWLHGRRGHRRSSGDATSMCSSHDMQLWSVSTRSCGSPPGLSCPGRRIPTCFIAPRALERWIEKNLHLCVLNEAVGMPRTILEDRRVCMVAGAPGIGRPSWVEHDRSVQAPRRCGVRTTAERDEGLDRV
jgi:hypothetical protein